MNSKIFQKKNFFSKNLKKNKNIIFFTGHVRSYFSISDYIKKFIIENDLNVVLSLWYEKKINYKKIFDDLKPLYLDIQKFDLKNTYNIFGKKCMIDKAFGRSALSTRSQIYKIDRSIKIIKQIEKKNKTKFPIYIKSRLDLLILSKLRLKKINNTIFFENTIGNWAIDRSDRFFYANRETFLKFEKNLKNFCREKWQLEKNYPILHKIPLQEILIKMYCDRVKINSIPIFPTSKIWREKNKPRLSDKFLMYIFVIKRLVKRKLMRFKS